MAFGSLAFTQRHERTPEERSLVRRLDIFLMTFGCVSQIIPTWAMFGLFTCRSLDQDLDQQNFRNAYVSGMKEDLGLYGNELNYFEMLFNVGYAIMLIPSQIILTYVRPSYWLSGLEIIWGVITGLIAITHKAQQVYALRFFLGLCESSAWPGMMTLLMHWYTPSELAKRMGFYHSCQAAGSLMSGALQVAITNTLHGANGLPGWRWLFIINAIMTIVAGGLGLFMLPDLPNNPNPRAFWFTKRDARLAMERLERHGRAEPKKMTWASAKRTFSSWTVYFVSVLYIATVLASWGYAYFNLFLKSLKNPDGSPVWTVTQVNAIPMGGSAINIAFVWIWAILSDLLRTRWTLIVAQAVIGIIPCIVLSIWTSHPDSTPLAAAYASYFISFLCLGTAPLIFAWLSDLLPQDPESRTLIVGVAIAVYYAISAWSQVLVWPAVQAPYYKYGWQSSIALWVLVIIMTCILRYIDVKYLRPKREAYHATLIESSKADDVEPAGVEDNQGAKNSDVKAGHTSVTRE
ncbi:Major facilitator superfamily domain- general substrate transporter [Apiospora kogelbergensis]|uniref:Major facilitator superfamily domain- general substrate transporter n=1 Tax=Apiospora kogelbergensis TaxID=1337665 RepID=A0AAW0QV64_9PEZI